MQIEVTKQNIEEYGLDELTGNTKDALLKAASEAARSGHTLYFQVPDRNRTQNVFDVFPGEVVDVAHDDSTNPIMGGGEPNNEAETGVGTTHECELPLNPMLYTRRTCPICGAKYVAEPSSSGVESVWIQEGEIDV